MNQIDWNGTLIRTDYVRPASLAIGQHDDQERQAVIDALQDAGRSFRMLELGAGFGRWTVLAAAEARKREIRYSLTAVEAEPTHYQWLRQHTRDNQVRRRWSRHGTCRLIHAALSSANGHQPFYVGRPAEWYGQALVRPYNAGAPADTVQVPTIRLSELLTRPVDLIDCDIQGAEEEVFREAAERLYLVSRVYVETHSVNIHSSLLSLFAVLGWTLINSAELGDTLNGVELSGGGFQYWLNPYYAD